MHCGSKSFRVRALRGSALPEPSAPAPPVRLSVCTVEDGRREQLVNLILGLRRSPRPPAELVIAARGEDLRGLPEASFPVRTAALLDELVSQAKARNAAAARTSGDMLVFLDAGCIAHPRLLDDYAAAARQGGLLMGNVRDLERGAAAQGVEAGLLDVLEVSRGDFRAGQQEPVEPIRDYRLFSAVNFAISARDFSTAGGFDERYVGQGGEDIDFSRKAMAAGLPFARLRGAMVYRQQHRQLMPPVDRLDTILANAQLFADKWHQPVMEDWLVGFERLGLVEHTEAGWRKLREPEERDMIHAQEAELPDEERKKALTGALDRRAANGRAGPLRPAA